MQLIGRPSIPEDWNNVVLTVVQGDGTIKPVQRFRYDETGFLLSIASQDDTDSIDVFVCTDISPGTLTLVANRNDDRIMEIEYHAQGGTVINAAHLLFSSEE